MDRAHYKIGNIYRQHYDQLRNGSHKDVSISHYPKRQNGFNCSSEIQEILSPKNQPIKISSQMDAVIRLMTGQETRTIADKLADSNRPTWEQYKKRNEDKLNLTDFDEKKMDDYRRKLDEEREKRLNNGISRNMKKSSKKRKKSQGCLRKDSDKFLHHSNKIIHKYEDVTSKDKIVHDSYRKHLKKKKKSWKTNNKERKNV